jgi:hypothetical protein
MLDIRAVVEIVFYNEKMEDHEDATIECTTASVTSSESCHCSTVTIHCLDNDGQMISVETYHSVIYFKATLMGAHERQRSH